MSIAEIKDAIEKLPPKKRGELLRWIHEWEDDEWDQQMAHDADAGKLDFLIREADQARKKGSLREWPK